MAIFGNFHDYDVTAEGSYDYEFGGAYDIAMETYRDEVAVIEAIHAYDIAETVGLREGMESSDLEYVLEGKLGDIWTKIKEFVKKFWAKVKAFFGNMIISIKNLFMSNKKFAEAYANKINPNYEKKDVVGYENYFKDVSTLYRVDRANTLKETAKIFTKFTNEIIAGWEKYDKNEDITNRIRQELIGFNMSDNEISEETDRLRYLVFYGTNGSGKLTSEEFIAKTDEYIKGKEVTKTVNASMVSTFFKSLLKVDDTVKRLENARKTYDAATKSILDTVNKVESKVNSLQVDMSNLSDAGRDKAMKINNGISKLVKAVRYSASTFASIGNQINSLYGREISSVKSIVAFQRKFCVAAVKK